MDIRLILVPLFGASGDEAALKTASSLGRDFGASVEGLFVHADPREAVWRIGEGVSAAVVEQLQRALAAGAARRGAALSHFQAAVAACPGSEQAPAGDACWRELPAPEGFIPGREPPWVRAARLADLIVFAHAAQQRTRAILEAVLLGAGRPLLVTPSPAPPRLGARIAIAWNHTAAAARAVSAAMPMLQRAAEVHAFTIETRRTKAAAADELADYLRRHGVDARAHRTEANGTAVGRQLLATAERIDADLLIMGGYGHSRLQDLILGRVTRYALSHARVPLLMAH